MESLRMQGCSKKETIGVIRKNVRAVLENFLLNSLSLQLYSQKHEIILSR